MKIKHRSYNPKQYLSSSYNPKEKLYPGHTTLILTPPILFICYLKATNQTQIKMSTPPHKQMMRALSDSESDSDSGRFIHNRNLRNHQYLAPNVLAKLKLACAELRQSVADRSQYSTVWELVNGKLVGRLEEWKGPSPM